MVKLEEIQLRTAIGENHINVRAIDPENLQPTLVQITNRMNMIGNAIKDRLIDFEPTNLIYGDNKVIIGLLNPIPSERRDGDNFKGKYRITIERLNIDYE